VRVLRQIRRLSSDDPRRTILAGTLARSSSTFRVLIDLAADGFGPQAGMLARTMIEDSEVACWIAVHPDEGRLARLWIDHFDWQNLQLQPFGSTELPVGMTPESAEELRAAFGIRSGAHWTWHRLSARRNEVGRAWGRDPRRAGLVARLGRLLDAHEVWNNAMLRHSPWVVHPSVRYGPGGVPAIVTERTSERVVAARGGSYLSDAILLYVC
jgi:Family of unknown function (DUF5677)